MTPLDSKEVELGLKLCEYRAQGWRLVAEYRQAGLKPPASLGRFLGAKESVAAPVKGPSRLEARRNLLLNKIVKWFQDRDNQPATFKQVAKAVKATQARVRAFVEARREDFFDFECELPADAPNCTHFRLLEPEKTTEDAGDTDPKL